LLYCWARRSTLEPTAVMDLGAEGHIVPTTRGAATGRAGKLTPGACWVPALAMYESQRTDEEARLAKMARRTWVVGPVILKPSPGAK
jgi:hypothetical protein